MVGITMSDENVCSWGYTYFTIRITMRMMIVVRISKDQPLSVNPFTSPSTQLLAAPTIPASHAGWP